MKPYTGTFTPQPQQEASEKLPVGIYVGRILNAQEEEKTFPSGDTVQQLAIMLDVSEGEYTNFYSKQYKNAQSNSRFQPRYKGILRISIPEQGNQFEEIQRRILENSVWAIEQSNSGYHWDWDEKKLKGKAVGFVVREFEWEIEGRTGIGTEIGKLASVQDVRDGKVKLMPIRKLKGAAKAAAEQREAALKQLEEAFDAEIPFD